MTGCVRDALRTGSAQGRIACQSACGVAAACGVAPTLVGRAADEEGLRIAACQLGLFGYDAFGTKRWTQAADVVPEELEAALRAACVDGRIPCTAAWRLADERGLPRLLLGSLCETIGVRVSSCQLGCFA